MDLPLLYPYYTPINPLLTPCYLLVILEVGINQELRKLEALRYFLDKHGTFAKFVDSRSKKNSMLNVLHPHSALEIRYSHYIFYIHENNCYRSQLHRPRERAQ